MMARLCERPGCSNDAAVAYRFDAAERWVRLDAPGDDRSAGALCTRHADSMMVPRGWTLDDRRDSVPRLFRLPASEPTPATAPDPAAVAAAATDPTSSGDATVVESERPAPRRRRSRRSPTKSTERSDEGQQLTLDDGEATVLAITDRRTTPPGDDAVDPDATTALPWAPIFDDTDDLGGTLDAEGELLARAFRGKARRKPE